MCVSVFFDKAENNPFKNLMLGTWLERVVAVLIGDIEEALILKKASTLDEVWKRTSLILEATSLPKCKTQANSTSRFNQSNLPARAFLSNSLKKLYF